MALINLTGFNDQWTRLSPTIMTTQQSLQASLAIQGPLNTDFGTCRWNCDVAKGKSLLSERAQEIQDMTQGILMYRFPDDIYTSCMAYDKVSKVDAKLKNLVKRIDSIWNIWCIWNLICDLVTGSSRSIKNETKKLDALYSGHKAILETLKSQSDLLLNAAIADIDSQIDTRIQECMADFAQDGGNADKLNHNLARLTDDWGLFGLPNHFKEIFRKKTNAAMVVEG